jgi:hypothetical protein
VTATRATVSPQLIRSLMVDAQTVEVVSAFEEAGIRAILLKGRSTRALLHDRGELRAAGDIDLLVAPDQLAAAERRLGELGFVNAYYDRASPASAPNPGDPWYRRPDGVEVDLHRRIWEVGVDAADAFEVVWRDRTMLSIGDLDVPVPSVPARALMIALHVAHHHGETGRQGRGLTDVKRAVERLEFDVWEEALELARRLDAEDAFAGGLGFGGTDAVALRRRLRLAPVSLAPAPEPPPLTAETLIRLLEAGSLRERASMLVRELVPSRAFMRAHAYRAGRPAPEGAGLIVAHVRRWADVARAMPTGLRAARAQQRDAIGVEPSVEGVSPFASFDGIFCLNLDDALERWEAAAARHAKLGISRLVERFPAVATPDDHHVGCTMSFRLMVAEAQARGYEHVLIFEDDAVFLDDAIGVIDRAIAELPEHRWDLLFLGACVWAKEFPFLDASDVLQECGPVTCTHAVAIHSRVYAKILADIPPARPELDTWLEDARAIDQYFARCIQAGELRALIISPRVASQPYLLGWDQGDLALGDRYVI